MKSVAIIGAGESGVGAAILAKKLGYDVFVSDGGKISEKYKEELNGCKIPYEEGGHSFELVLVTDVVIKSPGVPDHAPILRMLKEKGRKVISEIEFGSNHYSGLTIAITGSNGKTTASGLLYHILKTAGKNVALGGNYGKSFARIIAEDLNPDFMVLEVSSFQLDDIQTFSPKIAILLNITPDHLDRYEYQMSKYVDAKFRIIENQTKSDWFIYNGDDAETLKKISTMTQNSKWIEINRNNYLSGILSKDSNQHFEISVKGEHNLFNSACCVEACRILGLSEAEISDGLKTFVNLPHRLEDCGEIRGVQFINDSKATNVESAYFAIQAMTKPIILVMGGTDKGNDYTTLVDLAIKKQVKALICLGVDNTKLVESFGTVIPEIVETREVEEVIQIGLKVAAEGDVVLLSPACASFDLFKNYIDRGDQFRDAVAKFRKSLEKAQK